MLRLLSGSVRRAAVVLAHPLHPPGGVCTTAAAVPRALHASHLSGGSVRGLAYKLDRDDGHKRSSFDRYKGDRIDETGRRPAKREGEGDGRRRYKLDGYISGDYYEASRRPRYSLHNDRNQPKFLRSIVRKNIAHASQYKYTKNDYVDGPTISITTPLTTKDRRAHQNVQRFPKFGDTRKSLKGIPVPRPKRPPPLSKSRKGVLLHPSRVTASEKSARVVGEAIGGVPDNFLTLELIPELVDVLKGMNICEPTEIQAKVIPRILRYRENMVVSAETGSGKTLAYVLPMIQQAVSSSRLIPNKSPYALVLVPNQHLVQQVGGVIASIGRALNGIQVAPIYHPSDAGIAENTVLVATPRSVRSQFKSAKQLEAAFEFTEMLVVDEVDQLLGGGYEEDTKFIFDSLKSTKKRVHTTKSTSNMGPRAIVTTRQFLFVGATINHISVMWPIEFAKRKLPNLRIVESAKLHRTPAALNEFFVPVCSQSMYPTLRDALRACLNQKERPLRETVPVQQKAKAAVLHITEELEDSNARLRKRAPGAPKVPLEFAFVFCDTVATACKLQQDLARDMGQEIDALAYHAEQSEEAAAEVLAAMQERQVGDSARFDRPLVVIATDALSRGLDLPRVSHVFHYPFGNDAMTYLHRVGRACRHKRPGVSVALVTREGGGLATALDLCSRGIAVRHPYQVIQYIHPEVEIPKVRIDEYNRALDIVEERLVAIQCKPSAWKGRAPAWVEQWRPAGPMPVKADLRPLFSRNRSWRSKFNSVYGELVLKKKQSVASAGNGASENTDS